MKKDSIFAFPKYKRKKEDTYIHMLPTKINIMTYMQKQKFDNQMQGKRLKNRGKYKSIQINKTQVENTNQNLTTNMNVLMGNMKQCNCIKEYYIYSN